MIVSIVTAAAAPWNWIQGRSWSFIESNVDEHPSSQQSTSLKKIEQMCKQMLKPFGFYMISILGFAFFILYAPSYGVLTRDKVPDEVNRVNNNNNNNTKWKSIKENWHFPTWIVWYSRLQ